MPPFSSIFSGLSILGYQNPLSEDEKYILDNFYISYGHYFKKVKEIIFSDPDASEDTLLQIQDEVLSLVNHMKTINDDQWLMLYRIIIKLNMFYFDNMTDLEWWLNLNYLPFGEKNSTVIEMFLYAIDTLKYKLEENKFVYKWMANRNKI